MLYGIPITKSPSISLSSFPHISIGKRICFPPVASLALYKHPVPPKEKTFLFERGANCCMGKLKTKEGRKGASATPINPLILYGKGKRRGREANFRILQGEINVQLFCFLLAGNAIHRAKDTFDFQWGLFPIKTNSFEMEREKIFFRRQSKAKKYGIFSRGNRMLSSKA